AVSRSTTQQNRRVAFPTPVGSRNPSVSTRTLDPVLIANDGVVADEQLAIAVADIFRTPRRDVSLCRKTVGEKVDLWLRPTRELRLAHAPQNQGRERNELAPVGHL